MSTHDRHNIPGKPFSVRRLPPLEEVCNAIGARSMHHVVQASPPPSYLNQRQPSPTHRLGLQLGHRADDIASIDCINKPGPSRHHRQINRG